MNISLPILCKSQRNEKAIETQTLIDSGARGDFLHQDFANKHRINLLPLDTPIIPQNVNGTLNTGGKITHYVYINILFDDQRMGTKLLVTNIEKNNLILGLPWLCYEKRQSKMSQEDAQERATTQESKKC